MRTTRIRIRNLFGIREIDLDGKSIELTGPKGAGKSSVIESLRYALTNRSERDYIIRQGADEGEIIIETDTGLNIQRKTRTNKADSVKVRDGTLTQTRPAEFLNGIFTPLQLNPIAFTQMSAQEKNRVILNLVEFAWDTRWIQEQFGEIPQGVDYSKHILEVLADIQSEKGTYFTSRQNINRDIKSNKSFIAEIGQGIPQDYNAEHWRKYNLSESIQALGRAKESNSQIERAQRFKADYDGKVRGLKADRDIAINAEEKAIASRREGINNSIARMEAEIAGMKKEAAGLDEQLRDKLAVIEAQFNESVAKLDADTDVAKKYADKQPVDTAPMQQEVTHAEAMIKLLNGYGMMVSKQTATDTLTAQSAELTRKIELARSLPGEILKTATIPIKGLTVEDGIPLINGLPISNLSDGELLELCVDVSVAKPGQLQIILIDGAEKLDEKSRLALYAKCQAKGLQIIATRVTDSDEMDVTVLDEAVLQQTA